MIAGLAAWLRAVEPAGAPELERALARVLREPARFEGAEALRPPHVHRLRFSATRMGEADPRSLVIKRMSLDRSHREQRALRVWLPRVGLGEHGAPLLAVAAAHDAASAWHVYEDLGDATLARLSAEPGALREASLRAATRLIAALHVRFVAHPLLADCRLAGQELGAGFFSASLRDALHGLAALRDGPLRSEAGPLVGRLLERLGALAGESDARSRDFAALDWPETLLHGDLWLGNVMLAAGERLHLVDWERAGVGAALYDLSTFLRQLPGADRPLVLDTYRACVGPAGWPWPEPALFERVAESCELGRFASCLAWRVLSALEPGGAGDGPPDWLFDDLVEMERWFRERTALLPERSEASAA